jgi:hypothetical protein
VSRVHFLTSCSDDEALRVHGVIRVIPALISDCLITLRMKMVIARISPLCLFLSSRSVRAISCFIETLGEGRPGDINRVRWHKVRLVRVASCYCSSCVQNSRPSSTLIKAITIFNTLTIHSSLYCVKACTIAHVRFSRIIKREPTDLYIIIQGVISMRLRNLVLLQTSNCVEILNRRTF